ncbi:restriction endonuclease subunit M [Shewanella morhuae]|uniref:site-specific DNA-methyltransferase (adenine-specific) n=1 Tax=Shewanella morhuae TaxID=365591 RepID=A0ABX5HYR8_9GAMM|nr:restriction endonuclease subunit M [Shewanella morhuae]
MDLLRKDTGINNAIDAMEQLSLLLIIKYFYDVVLIGMPRKGHVGSFKDLFYNLNHISNGDFSTDFYALRQALNDIVRDIDSNEHDFLGFGIWKKIESILDTIPFKIRSTKILDSVLCRLEELDFFGGLEIDFDKLLLNMVKDSSSSGAFHSPKSLIKAIVNVTKPSPEEKIYDPAMGSGRTFVEAKKYLATINSNSEFRAIGNDLSPFAYLIGTLNSLLNGVDIRDISLSDSLLCSDDYRYDVILSGIPFGQASEISKYEYYYHGYSGSLEAMFLKHVMDKLAIGGRAALVVPDGVLFNSSNQLDMLRRQLLTKFNLHSILSLPNGTLAPYSGVKVSVLFFDNTVTGKDIWFYELNTAKPLGKLNLISDIDFKEFVSQFESRKTSENSFLIDKQSLINDKHCDLSFPLLKKEGQLKFNKNEMIDSLKKERLAFIELIASHFENISSNIDVQYVQTVTLKNICKLKTGDNLNKSEVFNSGAHPVYGGNGIIGYYGQSNRDGDSVIIGKVGMYCGNIHFSSKPYWLTSNAISLELTDSNAVFAPYLAHLLKSLDLNKLSTGTVQKFVSINQLYSLEISLPNYQKQVELSNWFDTLEENRVKIKQLLSNFSNELDSVTTSSIIEKALKNGVTL